MTQGPTPSPSGHLLGIDPTDISRLPSSVSPPPGPEGFCLTSCLLTSALCPYFLCIINKLGNGNGSGNGNGNGNRNGNGNGAERHSRTTWDVNEYL